jgi:hypothetical protein
MKMTLTKEQLREVRKVAKELSLNIEIPKTLGHGFWIDHCKSSIAGFIEWMVAQKAIDNAQESIFKFGLLLSKFNIDTVTDNAMLLVYTPYTALEGKWVSRSVIIKVNGNSVVPWNALKN